MLNFAAALLVGLVLGLLGAGGGIITVPALLYGTAMGMKQAVAHTIVILGLITLAQSVAEWGEKNVRLEGSVPFFVSSVVGAFVGARLSVLWIPEQYLVLILATVVLVAAFLMARKAMAPSHHSQTLVRPDSIWKLPLLVGIGFSTSVLSGMIGISGGFAMVPALSLVGGFPMTVAVGTNIAIVAIKSFFGALGYIGEISWRPDVILLFVVCGIGGSFMGARLRKSVSERALQITFAGFLVAVSGFMIWDRLL